MSRIFISYRRDDSAAEAGRIYDYLENCFGCESIFKDVDVIKPGDNFRDRIQTAVGQCEVLLAVIGKNWLHMKDAAGNRRLDNPADWVRLEIETALNRNVRVIPVLLDGVEMPAFNDLPEVLQDMAYRNAAWVRHDPDFRNDMSRLVKVVGQELAVSFFSSGLAKYKAQNYQGAIADYDQALRLNPNDAVAYNNRGLAKSDLGDKEGVIADYRMAAKLYQRQGNTEFYTHAVNAMKQLDGTL